MRGKSRKNTENKQTFDLLEELKLKGKIRQNAENKQTFDIFLIPVYILFTSSHPQFPYSAEKVPFELLTIFQIKTLQENK